MPKSIPDKHWAFVVSTGRTGTDFFTALFNEMVDNAWSLHEPSPAFRARSYELVGRKHSLYEKYYFSLPRKWRHRKREEDWYVETNYHLFAAIPLIRDAFTNQRIIHIIRDGRKVVTSWLNKYRYITNNHITPFHIHGDSARDKWQSWNALQKLSWYWKTVNETVEAQNPDFWLSFENIFQPPHTDLFKLLEGLPGIGYNSEKVKAMAGKKVNKTHQNFFPDYEEWPDHWKNQFWEIAGDAMKRFGYEED